MDCTPKKNSTLRCAIHTEKTLDSQIGSLLREKHLTLSYGIHSSKNTWPWDMEFFPKKTVDPQIWTSLWQNTWSSGKDFSCRKDLTLRYWTHSQKRLDSQLWNSLPENTVTLRYGIESQRKLDSQICNSLPENTWPSDMEFTPRKD